MDDLSKLAEYSLGGLTLIGAWYAVMQTLKRAGIVSKRNVPVINLILAAVFAGSFLWFRALFVFLMLTFTLAGLVTLYHGGSKEIQRTDEKKGVK